MSIAQRMDRIAPFHVMALLARARELEAQGRDIVHMEIGEPDFSTPERITEAAVAAMRQGKTHYTPALGVSALREGIADFYQSRYGVSITPSRVVVTPGSSGALQLIMGVLVNPGQQVIMADPGYPCNRHFVELVGGQPRLVPVDGSTHYQLTLQQVKDHWNEHSVAVMLASPSNPCGTLIDEQELRAIIHWVEARGGVVIVDEIYHGLIYGPHPQTAAAFSESLFVVNSFSKYFAMTGYRVGWLIAPTAYLDAIDRLAQNLFLAPSTPAQYGALAALEPESLDILQARVQVFQQRRDFLLAELPAMGFRILSEPQGAFYIYADCSAISADSFELCRQLLEQADVAVTPGADFGLNQPQIHVRFAYTTDISRLKLGIARIKAFLQG
ncbi:MAG: pyridoxal phosphate-dependent aminotransferase [Gammaproteobacteria bacterium]|nr:pyridoxal phosphate-dependent aminotransferase [Gammaproteobacteria bacterium]